MLPKLLFYTEKAIITFFSTKGKERYIFEKPQFKQTTSKNPQFHKFLFGIKRY